jgi:hypothetical protein
MLNKQVRNSGTMHAYSIISYFIPRPGDSVDGIVVGGIVVGALVVEFVGGAAIAIIPSKGNTSTPMMKILTKFENPSIAADASLKQTLQRTWTVANLNGWHSLHRTQF